MDDHKSQNRTFEYICETRRIVLFPTISETIYNAYARGIIHHIGPCKLDRLMLARLVCI